MPSIAVDAGQTGTGTVNGSPVAVVAVAATATQPANVKKPKAVIQDQTGVYRR